jgi:uncharacterized cupredoxin-like copper-binding protein
MAFVPADLTVKGTKFRFVLKNDGKLVHNLAIVGKDGGTPRLAAGATGWWDIELTPKTYEIYCSVDGHVSKGMRGTLTVTP